MISNGKLLQGLPMQELLQEIPMDELLQRTSNGEASTRFPMEKVLQALPMEELLQELLMDELQCIAAAPPGLNSNPLRQRLQA